MPDTNDCHPATVQLPLPGYPGGGALGCFSFLAIDRAEASGLDLVGEVDALMRPVEQPMSAAAVARRYAKIAAGFAMHYDPDASPDAFLSALTPHTIPALREAVDRCALLGLIGRIPEAPKQEDDPGEVGAATD